jgi:hypothetical protein
MSEKCLTSGLMHRSKQRLLLDHLVGESYETWRTSRPETEALKHLQRFDDDVQGLR